MVVINKMRVPLISVTICLLLVNFTINEVVARNTESHKVSF